MSDIRSRDVTGGTPASSPVQRADAAARRKAVEAPAVAQSDPMQTVPSHLRARLMELGATAETLQRNAVALQKAIGTLDNLQNTLRFALDAAKEAATGRTMAPGAVDQLQQQLDLAINSVDCEATSCAFSGQRLFDGAFSVELDGEKVSLPRLSAQDLGGPPSGTWQDYSSEQVEYSQSIASAASGGPNSLSMWAQGAAGVFTAALDKVSTLKNSLGSFYDQTILPQAAKLAVSMANALASNPRLEDASHVAEILAQLKSGLRTNGAAEDGRPANVLRLLE
jgi:flagellin-like hook-associated protein FlgL